MCVALGWGSKPVAKQAVDGVAAERHARPQLAWFVSVSTQSAATERLIGLQSGVAAASSSGAELADRCMSEAGTRVAVLTRRAAHDDRRFFDSVQIDPETASRRQCGW